jgi:hypothetical protein
MISCCDFSTDAVREEFVKPASEPESHNASTRKRATPALDSKAFSTASAESIHQHPP